MAKLFGIEKESPKTNHSLHNTESLYDESGANIDVMIDNEKEHESDIGQIAVDIIETAGEIVIVAPVAGVDPSLIDISLSRNILTISGERQHFPIYLDAKRMLVEECFYGPFSRSIILPENLAFNKIRANIEFQSIIIHVPKLVFTSKSIRIEEKGENHTKKEAE